VFKRIGIVVGVWIALWRQLIHLGVDEMNFGILNLEQLLID
jgi:hypothetical protein